MIIENPTQMYCVRKAFGSWCILSPEGHVLGMSDLWGDAIATCDNVYLAWAERYCRFINSSLYAFYNKYHRHPLFDISREIARQGQDRTYISLKELEEYDQKERAEQFEFELNYEDGEYEE